MVNFRRAKFSDLQTLQYLFQVPVAGLQDLNCAWNGGCLQCIRSVLCAPHDVLEVLVYHREQSRNRANVLEEEGNQDNMKHIYVNLKGL